MSGGGGGGGSQTPAPTQQERELARVGAEQWNDYARTYAGEGGVNDKFIQATRATEADRQSAAAQVGADSAMATRKSLADTDNLARARGISSSSPAALAAASADMNSASRAKGLAVGKAVQGVDDTETAANFKLASFGRGLADDSRVGLQSQVRRATDLVNSDAQSRYAEKASVLGAVGTGIGMYTAFKTDPKGKTPEGYGITPYKKRPKVRSITG